MADWRRAAVKTGEVRYEIPRSFRSDMRVPGVLFANDAIYEALQRDDAPEQAVNVASLPGICKRSIALPDIHYGYGFPIGGVAAMRLEDGVISPGGVGYDINCGVRLLRCDLSAIDLKDRAERLANELFAEVPCGLGVGGDIRLSASELDEVCREGARWAVARGHGWSGDLETTESGGRMAVADMEGVSERAVERGRNQLGTLGSGNHFVEIQMVREIFDPKAAEAFGLFEGQITAMIHTGSRGFGAQVCTDHLSVMKKAMVRYGIELPDRQLACAPIDSEEGRSYWASMCAAANYAWANRQCLAWRVRGAFEKTFGVAAERLGMHQVYDVAHNIAKREEHDDGTGRKRTLCVHRKGATRAFPAGHPEVPARYREVGQPTLVPGDMGRASYVLTGRPEAMEETFGSMCHGAGRLLSRSEAKRRWSSQSVFEALERKGILLRAADNRVVMEEAPEAYKDVSQVVDTCVQGKLATRTAMLVPLIVVKG